MGKSEELNEKMELVTAEISLNAKGSDVDESALDEELKRVDRELEKYDCQADMADYGLAVFGGIVSGIIDSLFVGDISGDISDIALSHEQVNRYIESYAKKRGYEGDGLKKSISYLEKELTVISCPLIYKMEDIIKAEGVDYSQYEIESKKIISSCASVAVSIKTVLDTALLTEDGVLSEESEKVVNK